MPGDDQLLDTVCEADAARRPGEGELLFDPQATHDDADGLDDEPADPMVGRYRLLDRLGVGGMGTVFLAEDPELERQVAIKLLHSRSADHSQVRLLREAQAMARVSHPNVAAVYDVGRFGSETFVAMEYIAGGTLEDWLEQTERSWREIVKLFIAAGRGLAAAHAADLIHRDFKPANVLIGLDGVPKVTDFGLVRASARALESLGDSGAAMRASAVEEAEAGSSSGSRRVQPRANVPTGPVADAPSSDASSSNASGRSSQELRGTRSTGGGMLASTSSSGSRVGRALALRVTRAGAAMGTPAYMAPEQLRGDAIDGRSDQFSFCIALYEALYAEPPFCGDDIKARVQALALDERRPRPSSARAREVPGWVDAIVERGLSHDPAARWPSMEALLEALADDPWLRRRRRRRAVISAGLSLALVTGVGLGAWGVEQRRARACDATAEGAAAAWSSRRADLRRALEAGGEHYAAAHAERVEAAFEGWTQRWGRTRRELCMAHGSGRAADERAPVDRSGRVAAAERRCLDDQLAAFEAVLAIFEEAAERPGVAAHALATADALPDPSTCREDAREQVDAGVGALVSGEGCGAELHGALHRVRALDHAGLYQDGAAAAQALLARPALRTCPSLHDEAQVLAAELDLALNHDDEAEAGFRAVLRSAGTRDDLPTALRASQGLSAIARQRDAIEVAWVWHEFSALFVERLESPPELVVELTMERAHLHLMADQPEAVERELEAARARIDEVLGDQHPTWLRWYNLQADLLDMQGKAAEAAEASEAALNLAKAIYGPDHPEAVRALVTLSGNLSDLDGERALALQHTAFDMARRIYPPGHPSLLHAQNGLAVTLVRAGQLDQAVLELESLIAQIDALPEDQRDLSQLGQFLSNYGAVLRRLERHQEAEPHLRRSVAVTEAALGPDHHRVGLALLNLGNVIGRLGKMEESIAVQTRALRIFETLDPNHQWVALVLGNLGKLNLGLDRPDEALRLFERGANVARVTYGEDHPRYVERVVDLARAEAALGQREQAQLRFDRAFELCAAQARKAELDSAQARLDRAQGDGRSLRDEECSFALGALTRFHLDSQQPARAVEAGARAYAVRERIDDPVERANLIFAYAEALAANARYEGPEGARAVAAAALEALAQAPENWADVAIERARMETTVAGWPS
ncbi:serine/threonine kinase family protein [Plesiocystis pacifica SIR-1]|uniref:non-specific serine/threonine protein kinase n=1 Tax=Plesiocystis pacifica SIR-1 TaxID=391625 RepID=A6G597_9BACT|nr:serine/threonine-protein kinase [Plesiocystis pacifica]EDM79009.1 serine/threonine kinase family protein [Plesiocystis pacifica SIR-1]